MRAKRVGHVGRYLARCVPVGCMLVLMLGMLVASCTQERRHRILSSFFDGVPPLNSGASGALDADSGSSRRAGAGDDSVVYVHEPQRERQCERCHGFAQKENFSREVQLTAPVPDLCFECHEEMSSLEGWVHGPVAAGECLVCHEPHRSSNRGLLKLPIPDMCFRCHDPQAVASITNHDQDIYVKCGACHSGHASESRYLLRGDAPEEGELVELAAQEAGQREAEGRSADQVVLEASGKIRDGHSLEDMLGDVRDFVRRGQIEEAKVYVKAIMQSDAYTDEQKRSIGPALLRMEEPPSSEDESGEPVSVEVEQAETSSQDQVEVEQPKSMSIEEAGELYMESLKLYKAGELLKAKGGFEKVLYSGATPEPVQQAIREYLAEIERALAR